MRYTVSEIAESLERNRDKGIHVWLEHAPRFVDYGTVRRDIDLAAARLRSWGVRSGMSIGIASESSYEWVVYDLTLLSLGCRLVAIPEEVPLSPRTCDDYGIHLLLVSSKRGAERSSLPAAVAFVDAAHAEEVCARVDLSPAEEGSDGLTVTFSSGTTGIPKGMLISKRGAEHWITYLVNSFGLNGDDSVLIFLPLSHFQQRMLLYVAVLCGMDFMLTNPERVFAALPRLQPTVLVAPPMFYESIENRARRATTESPQSHRAQVDALLGARMRWLFTGFAPIQRETLEFYDELGLPLFEGYGVTECGQIGLNKPGARRLGSAGKPVDDATVVLADDGEILVAKQYPLSLGYVGHDAANISKAEWFHTGDIGRFDSDGFLYVVGRKKELIVTRGGYKVHPQELEDKLNRCASVQRAVVFGDNLPSLVAVLSIAEATSEAEKDEIREFVTRLNENSVSARRIGKVVFTACAFDEGSGYLTRSLKLNRPAVFEAFKAELVGNA